MTKNYVNDYASRESFGPFVRYIDAKIFGMRRQCPFRITETPEFEATLTDIEQSNAYYRLMKAAD